MGLRENLSTTKDFLHVILLLMLIAVIGLGVIWFGMSVWANVTEGNLLGTLPKLPGENADYVAEITVTGEVLLTPGFDTDISPHDPAKQVYILHGFYRLLDDKWRWVKDDFPMDEYYWGEIKIEKRK